MTRVRSAGVVLLLLCLAPAVRADKIKMSAGNVVQGYVVAETADAYTVSLPSGIETQVAKADVVSVEAENDPAKLTAAAAGFLAKQRFRTAAALYGRVGTGEAAGLKRLCADLDKVQAAVKQEEFSAATRLIDALPAETAAHPATAALRDALAAARADCLRKIDVAILTRNFAEADKLIAKRKPEELDREFRRRSARVLQDQADRFFFREQHDQAVPRYEALMKLDPDTAPEIRMRLAYSRARVILAAGGDGVDAKLAALLEFEPGLQIAHRKLGQAAYERNDRAAAVQHFKALLEPARDLPVPKVPDDVEELKYLATRVCVKPKLQTDAPALLERVPNVSDKWQSRITPCFTLNHRNPIVAACVAQALDVYVKSVAEQVLGPGATWTPEKNRPLYLYRFMEDRGENDPLPNTHNLGFVDSAIGILGEGDELIADLLPHEIAHVILGEKQWALPMWAAEGIALSVQRSDRIYDSFYEVERAIEDGRELPMDELLGTQMMVGKDAGYYQQFTAQTWTVMDYLIDRKGGTVNFIHYVNDFQDRYKVKARKQAEAKRYEDPTATTVHVQVEITLAMSYGSLKSAYAVGELKSFAADWREYVGRVVRGEPFK